jgi:FtsZ-binding cell division protein ZapB
MKDLNNEENRELVDALEKTVKKKESTIEYLQSEINKLKEEKSYSKSY